MTKIAALVAEFCPEGVALRSLDEIGTLYSGLTGKAKADFADGNERFATYMNVFSNIATDVLPDDRVRVGQDERQNRVRYGDVLFTASSESADEVGMASAVTAEPPEPLYLNSFCFGFRAHDSVQLDPEFSKHLFRSTEIRKRIIRTANGVTRINISKERFRGVRIPVPPLEVQREIVKILDAFTQLEAELEARRRQYEHYRRQIVRGIRAERVRLDDLGRGGRRDDALEGRAAILGRRADPLARVNGCERLCDTRHTRANYLRGARRDFVTPDPAPERRGGDAVEHSPANAPGSAYHCRNDREPRHARTGAT